MITDSGVINYLDDRGSELLLVLLRKTSQIHPPDLICSHSELRACAFISLTDTTFQPFADFCKCLSSAYFMLILLQKHWGHYSAMTDSDFFGTQSGWGLRKET